MYSRPGTVRLGAVQQGWCCRGISWALYTVHLGTVSCTLYTWALYTVNLGTVPWVLYTVHLGTVPWALYTVPCTLTYTVHLGIFWGPARKRRWTELCQSLCCSPWRPKGCHQLSSTWSVDHSVCTSKVSPVHRPYIKGLSSQRPYTKGLSSQPSIHQASFQSTV